LSFACNSVFAVLFPSLFRRIVLLFTLLPLTPACNRARAASARTVDVMEIREETSSDGVALTAVGTVEARTSAHVATSIEARIARVLVREGDHVRAGDPIAELDAVDVKASVQAAAARVWSARARAVEAHARLAEEDVKLDRQRRLHAEGLASKGEIDDGIARRKTLASAAQGADADVNAARVDLTTARDRLGRCIVRAPISGTVLGKVARAGDATGPRAAPIAEIADFASLVVKAHVPEERLNLVQLGASCDVTLESERSAHRRGRVARIGTEVDPERRTVAIEIELSERDGALPNMEAKAGFHVPTIDGEAARATKATHRALVPPEALAERDGHMMVFVVNGDRVRATEVVTGERIEGALALLRGPAVGTSVVVLPPQDLADGDLITKRAR
jgi:HlyD family secretion protein